MKQGSPLRTDSLTPKPVKTPKLIAITLVVICAAILGFTAWFTYSSYRIAQQSYAQANNVSNHDHISISAETLAKKYSDGLNLVSAMYPASWKVATSLDRSDPNYPGVTTTITSPRGTVLYLNLDWGGRGGACFANPTDKPFQAGNMCSSSEILSSVPSGITNVYDYIAHVTSTSYSQTFGKSNIVMTTKHYADPEGSQKYVIGLTASDGSYPVVLNKPEMGYVTQDDWFSAYGPNVKWYGEIHAYASFDKAPLLNSQDALTVRAILRSITVNLPS